MSNELNTVFLRISELSQLIQKEIWLLIKTHGSLNSRKVKKIIDDLDNTMVEYVRAIPEDKMENRAKEDEVIEKTMQNLEKRKRKLSDKYSLEINQNKAKYLKISKYITDSTTEICDEISQTFSGLENYISNMRLDTERRITDLKNDLLTKNEESNNRFEAAKLDDQTRLQSEFAEVEASYHSQIQLKGSKIEQILASVANVESEKAKKIETFVTECQIIEDKWKEKKHEIMEHHNDEYSSLVRKQNEIKWLISMEKDRIESTQDRIRIAKQSMRTRLEFMTFNMNNIQLAKIKQWRLRIVDTQEKIRQCRKETDDFIDSSSKEIDQLTSDMHSFLITQKKHLQEQVKCIVDSKKMEYESTTNELKEKLDSINSEIEKNQRATFEATLKIREELKRRISEQKSKNDEDIHDIEDEISRIERYKASVDEEWATLSKSTEGIYHYRIKEANDNLAKQKIKHELEISSTINSNQPITEVVNYQQLLKEEVSKLESNYREEEIRLMNERNVMIRAKNEEEKARGYLTTRKSLASELGLLKEKKEQLKKQLSDYESISSINRTILKEKLQADKLSIERSCNQEILNYQNSLQDQLNLLEIEYVEVTQKRSKLEEEYSLKMGENQVLQTQVDQKKKEAKKQNNDAIIQKHNAEIVSLEQRLIEMDSLLGNAREEEKSIDLECELINNQIQKSKSILIEKKAENIQKFNDEMQKQKLLFEDQIKEKELQIHKVNLRIDQESKRLLDAISEKQLMASENALLSDKELTQGKETTNAFLLEMEHRILKEYDKNLQNTIKKHQEKLNEQKSALTNIEQDSQKEINYLLQDNRYEIRSLEEKHHQQLSMKSDELESLKSTLIELTENLKSLTDPSCKECSKLDEISKNLKKDIADLVENIQKVEMEDANRSYTASHFGAQKQILPPLKI